MYKLNLRFRSSQTNVCVHILIRRVINRYDNIDKYKHAVLYSLQLETKLNTLCNKRTKRGTASQRGI